MRKKGMFNIFAAIFFSHWHLHFIIACGVGGVHAVSLFVSYLLAIAVFGLFQAVFMANAGGAWDNAKTGGS